MERSPAMGTVRIKIRNFEIIQKADFTVDGLTGLIGETNHGKTSVVRSILYALVNRPGRDFVRHKQSKAVVALSFRDFSENPDFNMVWTKGASSSYRVSGLDDPLEKTGKTTPQEVIDGACIYPLIFDKDSLLVNFLTQLDPPLIRDLNESSMYGLIIKSLDGDRLGEAVRLSRNDMDERAEAVKVAQITLDVHQQQMLRLRKKAQILATLDPLKPEYEQALRQRAVLEKVTQQGQRLRAIDTDRRALERSLKQARTVLAKLDLEPLKQAKQQHLALLQRHNALTRIDMHINVHELVVSNMDDVLKKVPDVQLYSVKQRKLKRLTVLSQSLTSVDEQHNETTQALSTIDSAMKSADDLAKLSKAQKRLRKYTDLNKQLVHWDELITEASSESDSINAALEKIQGMIASGICPVCERKAERGHKMDITKVQANVDELKKRSAHMNGRLDSLKEQREKIVKEITDLGVDPDNLDEEIKKLTANITAFEKRLAPVVEQINTVLESLDKGSDEEEEDVDFS